MTTSGRHSTLFSITPEYENFNGCEWNPTGTEELGYWSSAYGEGKDSRIAFFFLPIWVFSPNANNFRFINSETARAQMIRIYLQLLMIFGTVFGGVSAELSLRGARHQHVAAITMIPKRPETNNDEFKYEAAEEEHEEKKEKEKNTKFVGMVISCSYRPLHTVTDEQRDDTTKYDPAYILAAQLEINAKKTVKRYTSAFNDEGRENRSTSKAGSSRSGIVHSTDKRGISSDIKTILERLTRGHWRMLADTYTSTIASNPLDESISVSAYNFYNVFSFEYAIKHAIREGADQPWCRFIYQHRFRDETELQHKMRLEATEHEAAWRVEERRLFTSTATRTYTVYFPCQGRHTYRIPATDLSPDKLSVAFFPNYKPPKPTLDDVMYHHYLRSHYHELTGKELPPDPSNAAFSEDEQAAYKEAVEKAHFTYRRTTTTITNDDGSLTQLIKACQQDFKVMSDRHIQEKETAIKASGPWDTIKECTITAKHNDEIRDWQAARIVEFQTRFTDHNEQMSEAECATAKFGVEYLEKYKTFCIPTDPEYKNISPFGNVVAMLLLTQENAHKVFSSHAPLILLQLASLAIWIGSPSEMRCHIMLIGDPQGGKSYLLQVNGMLMIPGTHETVDATSAKADLYENNRSLHKKCVSTEEADRERYAIGAGNGTSLRGQASAAQHGNNQAAIQFRNITTKGEFHYKGRQYSEDTGKIEPINIGVECQTAFHAASNCVVHDIAGPLRSRILVIPVTMGSRSDISVADLMASQKSSETRDLHSAAQRWFRRTQYLIGVLATLIEMKVLEPIDMTQTDVMFNQLQTSMAERGCNTFQLIRSKERFNLLLKTLALIHAIHLAFDSPYRIFNEKEEWTPTCYNKLSAMRVYLRTLPEHFFFLMPLMSCEWENPYVSIMVNIMSNHYNMCLPKLMSPHAGFAPLLMRNSSTQLEHDVDTMNTTSELVWMIRCTVLGLDYKSVTSLSRDMSSDIENNDLETTMINNNIDDIKRSNTIMDPAPTTTATTILPTTSQNTASTSFATDSHRSIRDGSRNRHVTRTNKRANRSSAGSQTNGDNLQLNTNIHINGNRGIGYKLLSDEQVDTLDFTEPEDRDLIDPPPPLAPPPPPSASADTDIRYKLTTKQRAEHFFYFEWSKVRSIHIDNKKKKSYNRYNTTTMTASATSTVPSTPDNSGGATNDESKSDSKEDDSMQEYVPNTAHWIDKLADHIRNINGEVGSNPTFYRTAIREFMDSQIDVRSPTDTEPRFMSALRWVFAPKTGVYYLRISKRAFAANQSSLVTECVKDLIHSYGLEQETYVIGAQEQTRKYLWQTITVDPSRPKRILRMRNPWSVSKVGSEIRAKQLTGSSDTKIYAPYPIDREIEAIPVFEFAPNEVTGHVLSMVSFFTQIRLTRLPLKESDAIDYRGRSLKPIIEEPEWKIRDYSTPWYKERPPTRFYGPATIDIYQIDMERATIMKMMNQIFLVSHRLSPFSSSKPADAYPMALPGGPDQPVVMNPDTQRFTFTADSKDSKDPVVSLSSTPRVQPPSPWENFTTRALPTDSIQHSISSHSVSSSSSSSSSSHQKRPRQPMDHHHQTNTHKRPAVEIPNTSIPDAPYEDYD